MGKFKFDLEAGLLLRGSTRTMLKNSIRKLENEYDGSSVSLTEEKYLTESIFHIRGTGFPDTQEFENVINNWFSKLKRM